jgi:hypothetical protein
LPRCEQSGAPQAHQPSSDVPLRWLVVSPSQRLTLGQSELSRLHLPQQIRQEEKAMISFINCPFCSGHESVSPEAARLIREAIALHLHRWRSTLSDMLVTELENICNVIDNTAERQQVERYSEALPICPTPAKRKYSNREHALPFAVKWQQNAYECECGFWHLSKQTPAEHAAKINSPPASPDEFETVDPLLL